MKFADDGGFVPLPCCISRSGLAGISTRMLSTEDLRAATENNEVKKWGRMRV